MSKLPMLQPCLLTRRLHLHLCLCLRLRLRLALVSLLLLVLLLLAASPPSRPFQFPTSL